MFYSSEDHVRLVFVNAEFFLRKVKIEGTGIDAIKFKVPT